MRKLRLYRSWGVGIVLGWAMAQESERRFKVLTLDEMTAAQREVADKIRSGPRAAVSGSAANAGNSVGSPFNVWLRSPESADPIQQVGSYIRFKSSLGPRLNEFAILITAREWTSQYEWFAHHRLAMQAGLSPQVAQAVAEGKRRLDRPSPSAVRRARCDGSDSRERVLHPGVDDAQCRSHANSQRWRFAVG